MTSHDQDLELHEAAAQADTERVRRLLRGRALPTDVDRFGATALFFARSVEVVDALLGAGAPVQSLDAAGDDALDVALEASFEGADLVVRRLVRAGLDPAQRDHEEVSRIVRHAARGHARAVRRLLALGVDPAAPEPGAFSALHAAARRGARSDGEDPDGVEVIRLVSAAGLDPDALDVHGATPLHEAASGDWGNPAAVSALLAVGAAVDATDHDGYTPLLAAARRGEPECVERLLAAGADPGRTEAEGFSALELAKENLEARREFALERPDPELLRLAGVDRDDLRRRLERLLDDARRTVRRLQRA